MFLAVITSQSCQCGFRSLLLVLIICYWIRFHSSKANLSLATYINVYTLNALACQLLLMTYQFFLQRGHRWCSVHCTDDASCVFFLVEDGGRGLILSDAQSDYWSFAAAPQRQVLKNVVR